MTVVWFPKLTVADARWSLVNVSHFWRALAYKTCFYLLTYVLLVSSGNLPLEGSIMDSPIVIPILISSNFLRVIEVVGGHPSFFNSFNAVDLFVLNSSFMRDVALGILANHAEAQQRLR